MLGNKGLVDHAISKLGKAYMYGYTGVVTEAIIQEKARQYPTQYTPEYIQRTRKNIGRWATDCSGLIDMYLGVDLSANMYYVASHKKGKISDIPRNVPGILVFKVNSNGVMNHVGVYMGDGTVIEAKGVDYGVVRTILDNAGWDYYGYCHLIDYVDAPGLVGMGKGAKGQAVVDWQKCLLYFGYSLPKYGADGDFGSETLAATINFQARHFLPTTGVVDKSCWTKLLEELQEESVDLKNQLSDVLAKSEVVKGYI